MNKTTHDTPFLLAIPFCKKDFKFAMQGLQWMIELDGENAYHDIECFLCWDGISQKELSEIEELAKRVFGKVWHVQSPYNEHGWPQGPNSMWRTIAKHVEMIFKKPFFVFEPDVIPLKRQWLHKLVDEYYESRCLFMGSMVALPGMTGHLHMNGAGIYPADVSEFLPYEALNCNGDSAWDVLAGDAIVATKKYRNSPSFQHHWFVDGTEQPMTFKTLKDLEMLEPEALVFHRNKDGSLINVLRQKFFSKPAIVTGRAENRTVLPSTPLNVNLNIDETKPKEPKRAPRYNKKSSAKSKPAKRAAVSKPKFTDQTV